MKLRRTIGAFIACVLLGVGPLHAEHPEPIDGAFTIKNFKFHTGEVMEEVTQAYKTIGDPNGLPVLVLHGTAGSSRSMLRESFADVLFGPGQPLDASKYFLILPDAIGTGSSTKPSDGLRASFPSYNLKDMVDAQYQMLTEGLGIDQLHLVIGNSMGGMVTWEWATRYPEFVEAAVPMASMPAPMSGRNWMMRRMLVDAVRTDPAWNNGDYDAQPPNLRVAKHWFVLATSIGDQRLQSIGATREKADAFVDKRFASFKVGDANDEMFQWNASRDFDPTEDLEKITAKVLVINSADDERNPLETGLMEAGMSKVADGEVYIVPGSPETFGHGTTMRSKFYSARLQEFMDSISE